MEAMPLVMEPESRMYADPVVVLDFQSLYPSQVPFTQHACVRSCQQTGHKGFFCVCSLIAQCCRLQHVQQACYRSMVQLQIIAYNLCFSTCLGRPAHATAGAEGTRVRLGAQMYGLPGGALTGPVAPDRCAPLLQAAP